MKNEQCYEVAKAEVNNEVVAKDILVEISGKNYIVTVTTESKLRIQNDPSEFFVVKNFDIEEICRSIHGAPFEEIEHLLLLQE